MAKSKALISVDELERAYAPFAKESAQALMKAEPVYSAMNIVRAKNKVFSLGETKLPSPLRIVVLAQAACQFYYEEEYDSNADSHAPPTCYALLSDDPFSVPDSNIETRLISDPKAPNRQFDGPCQLCPQNQPGSHPEGGRWRRACSTRRRLAFIFADDKSDDPQIGSIELSPTALRPWSLHVSGLVGVHNIPFYMAVTELSFVDTKADTWYVGASYAGKVTRERPEWLMPGPGVKLGSPGWEKTSLIGRKIQQLVESKQLIAPPAAMAEKPKKGKAVTGKERVSVKEAKERREAKKSKK